MTGLIKVLKGVDIFENDTRLLICIDKDFQVFIKVNNFVEVDESIFENQAIYTEIKILSDYAKRNPLMFLRHLKTLHNQIKEVLFVNSYYDFNTLEKQK
jgi:hypothetical protein